MCPLLEQEKTHVNGKSNILHVIYARFIFLEYESLGENMLAKLGKQVIEVCKN